MASDGKVYTYSEIKEESEKDNSTLIVIHNAVYNVTDFLNEHPGGEEVLLEQLGKDATEAFEDVGHSTDARDMMKKYKVGELAEAERTKKDEKKQSTIPTADSGDGESLLKLGTHSWKLRSCVIFICITVMVLLVFSSWKSWLLPIAIGLLATVAYRFFFLSQ